MNTLFIFPTNRTGLVNEIKKEQSPDNGLYGLNYFSQLGSYATLVDPPVLLERIVEFFFSPLQRLFHSQIDMGFQLGRVILQIPAMNRADVILTNTDSVGLPVCFLKRLGLIRPPIVYAVGLFYIRGNMERAIVSRRNAKFLRFYKWILSAADHIIYHSPIEKEKLIRLGIYNPACCSFVAMGSDANFFKLEKSKKQKAKIVLAVGRDHARDYKTLFKAAKKLPTDHFALLCSKRNIERLEIPNNVKVYLDVTYHEVRNWYQKASVVVIPMKEMYRSSGQMTLTDSFQSGKPIVVTDVVGIAHYQLSNEKDVLMVSPKNALQLVEAITRINTDKVLRNILIANSKRLAKRFTTKQYAYEMVKAAMRGVDKIKLRPIMKSDLEFIRRLRNENRQYFLDNSYVSQSAQKRWFESYCRKIDDYMFILQNGKEKIGIGAIYNIDLAKKTAEIGRFAIDKKFQGKNFGKNLLKKIEEVAIYELGLSTLRLEVFKDNRVAFSLYRESGFKVTTASIIQSKEVVKMEKKELMT